MFTTSCTSHAEYSYALLSKSAHFVSKPSGMILCSFESLRLGVFLMTLWHPTPSTSESMRLGCPVIPHLTGIEQQIFLVVFFTPFSQQSRRFSEKFPQHRHVCLVLKCHHLQRIQMLAIHVINYRYLMGYRFDVSIRVKLALVHHSTFAKSLLLLCTYPLSLPHSSTSFTTISRDFYDFAYVKCYGCVRKYINHVSQDVYGVAICRYQYHIILL